MSEFKIDPAKCIFVLDAIAMASIPAAFRKMAERIPHLKMYVYEKLDWEAKFGETVNTGIDPASIVRLTRDEMFNLAPRESFYAFRTNDVIFYAGDGEQQSMIYSCMGRMGFYGD